MKWRRAFVVLVVLVLGGGPMSKALDVVERTDEGVRTVSVENRFLSATMTALGGRLRSLTDKRTGQDLVLWAPGEGGFLDDRDIRTMATYDYRIVRRDAETAEVEFSVTDASGLAWKKTYTVQDSFPVIAVAYTITNTTDGPKTFEQMVRNFIRPHPGLYWLYHSDQGLQRVPWGDWTRAGDKSVWCRKVAGDWLALVQEDGASLVVVCDRLSTLHCWTGSGKGTVEWVYPGAHLQPGESVHSEAVLALVHGVKDVAHATRDYVLGFSYEEKVKEFTFENRFTALSARVPPAAQVRIETGILDTDRKRLATLPPMEVAARVGEDPVRARQTWKAPQDGMFIIEQNVFLGAERLGEYETPIVAGFLSADAPVYRHPKFPVERAMLELRLAEEDLKRGYFLHLPAEGPQRESLVSAALDLCRNEREFMEIRCTAFSDLGETVVTIEDAAAFPGRAEILVEKDYRLLSNTTMRALPGGRNAFFLALDTTGVPAGEYAVSLRFQPAKAPLARVKVAITVWPLDLPTERTYSVSFFWSSFECLFSAAYPSIQDKAARLGLWRQCLRQQRLAGQDILEIRPGKGNLGDFIRVMRFEDGVLPVLDLSGWDAILDVAREEGMRHVVFRYGWWHESWLPKGYKDMTPERQEGARLSILKQLVAHLKRKGFERISCYLIDELDPSPEKVEDICRQMRNAVSAVPGIEFAGSGFASTPLPQMQQLADLLTWVAPYWSVCSVVEWMQRGDLKLRPGTVRASQISGDHKTGYTPTRRTMWQYWRGGLTGYQVYGYYTHYPNHGYSCVFPEAAGPVPSPTFAGLVDGWEDFCLLHHLEERERALAAAGRAQEAARVQQVKERLVGPKDAFLAWEFVSSSGFVSPRAVGDDAAIRAARREVLRVLSETK